MPKVTDRPSAPSSLRRGTPLAGKPFVPRFIEPRGVYDMRGMGDFHPRPSYDPVELGSLVRWLNEREAGYPTVPYIVEEVEVRLEHVAD